MYKKACQLLRFSLTFLILTSLSFAQGEIGYGGLIFEGNKSPDSGEDLALEKRTTLNLSPDGDLRLPETFTLSFGLAIRKIQDFGYVFSAQNSDGEQINLAYTHFNNPDTSFLILSIRDQVTDLRIPLPKTELGRNKWHRIDLAFDIPAQKVTARVGNTFRDAISSDIPIMDSVKLTFGVQPLKWDAAGMALRDIRIFDNESESEGRLLYHWPLMQSHGNIAVERIQNRDGIVRNGKWLRRYHYLWESRPLFCSRTKVSESTYNPAQNMLYWTTGDSLWEYDINQARLKAIAVKEPIGQKDANLIYDPHNDRLLSIYHSHGSVTAWDKQGKPLSETKKEGFSGQYYAARKFIDPETGELYMLGGYGYYTVKKDLQRYNFHKEKWDTLTVAGMENFYPRSGAVIIPAGEKRHSQMKQVYDKFANDYKSLFGDEFKTRLKDITRPG